MLFNIYLDDHIFSHFIHMMDYIIGFLYVKPSLHHWDEANIMMVDDFLMCSWIWFASILLSIFASMFISKIGM